MPEMHSYTKHGVSMQQKRGVIFQSLRHVALHFIREKHNLVRKIATQLSCNILPRSFVLYCALISDELIVRKYIAESITMIGGRSLLLILLRICS